MALFHKIAKNFRLSFLLCGALSSLHASEGSQNPPPSIDDTPGHSNARLMTGIAVVTTAALTGYDTFLGSNKMGTKAGETVVSILKMHPKTSAWWDEIVRLDESKKDDVIWQALKIGGKIGWVACAATLSGIGAYLGVLSYEKIQGKKSEKPVGKTDDFLTTKNTGVYNPRNEETGVLNVGTQALDLRELLKLGNKDPIEIAEETYLSHKKTLEEKQKLQCASKINAREDYKKSIKNQKKLQAEKIAPPYLEKNRAPANDESYALEKLEEFLEEKTVITTGDSEKNAPPQDNPNPPGNLLTPSLGTALGFTPEQLDKAQKALESLANSVDTSNLELREDFLEASSLTDPHPPADRVEISPSDLTAPLSTTFTSSEVFTNGILHKDIATIESYKLALLKNRTRYFLEEQKLWSLETLELSDFYKSQGEKIDDTIDSSTLEEKIDKLLSLEEKLIHAANSAQKELTFYQDNIKEGRGIYTSSGAPSSKIGNPFPTVRRPNTILNPIDQDVAIPYYQSLVDNRDKVLQDIQNIGADIYALEIVKNTRAVAMENKKTRQREILLEVLNTFGNWVKETHANPELANKIKSIEAFYKAPSVKKLPQQKGNPKVKGVIPTYLDFDPVLLLGDLNKDPSVLGIAQVVSTLSPDYNLFESALTHLEGGNPSVFSSELKNSFLVLFQEYTKDHDDSELIALIQSMKKFSNLPPIQDQLFSRRSKLMNSAQKECWAKWKKPN